MSPTGGVEHIAVGQALVGIELQLASIRFTFTKPVVEFCAPFSLIAGDGAVVFVPWERTGDLNLLWPLIDRPASHIQMTEESFRLVFDDGTVLQCRQQGAAPELVLVWGGESPKGGIELTRYPADLYPPAAPSPRPVPRQDVVLRPPITPRKTGA
jgi:hypothetical protein